MKVNSHFRSENPSLEVPFGRVKGSLPGVYKATERYFTPDIEVEDLPNFIEYERCMKLMYQIYKPYVGHCAPDQLKDVYFNAKSAIGYCMKQFSKQMFLEGKLKKPWRFKYEVFQHLPNLVLFLNEWGWRLRIPVLWETSGKAEILKIKKVLKGDIRTFTFADPFFTLNFCHMLSGVKSLIIFFSNIFHLSCIRMGASFVRGNFHAMINEMRNMFVVKGDCIKWDASFKKCLVDVVKRILMYILNITYLSDDYFKLEYFLDQCHFSFVRMPCGEVYLIFYKKSGDPWTTGGNSMAHLFILCCHLIWMADKLGMDPYILFLKMRWNIYADDHLNGYPRICKPLISFEHRERFYKAFGVNLHPPPEDVIFDGPVGGIFLGAQIAEVNGRYEPRYTKERLLAILWCKEYTPEELQQVLISIGPLINSNKEAKEILACYIEEHYPALRPILDINSSLFSGAESASEDGWYKKNEWKKFVKNVRN